MRKWTLPALLAALALAVLLRIEPLFKFQIWGSDSGEYYALIKGLMDHGYISTVYSGWGFGYPYFPGAELLVGSTALVSGVDMLVLLKLVLPLLGATTSVLAFMIGRTAFQDERAGLIAAGIVAVAMPHVFATSHPMPGTLGDLLAAVCILLYLKVYEDRRALVPLTIASVALVPTHHLSAFFVFAPLLFITFVRELLRSKEHPVMARVDIFYLSFMLAANLVYWMVLATPFREQVMTEAFGMNPFIFVGGVIALLFVAPFIVYIRRKRIKFRYSPKGPGLARVALYLAVITGMILAWLAFTAFVEVPGTNISVPPDLVVFLLPTSLLFAIGITGATASEFSRRGLFIWLWLTAVSLILLMSILTRNTVIVAYRVHEYITLPLALLAGFGVCYMADLHFEFGPGTSKGPRLAVAAGITVLVLASAVTAYPPNQLLGGFEEGTTCKELGAVVWAGQEIPTRQSLVATDHRMSSMLFGFAGLNATWDSAYHTLHDDLNGSRAELQDVEAPSGHSRINYVLIDDVIENGVALNQFQNAEPMSKEAKAKFSEPPFQKVYEGRGVDIYFVGTVA